MSWVAALSGVGASLFYPPFDRLSPHGDLRKGTVLIELSLAPITSALSVLRMPLQAHAAGHLSILALPKGSFSIVVSQGRALVHKTVRLSEEQTRGDVRLSLSWDCEAGQARFTVEAADSTTFSTALLDTPQPMSLESLTAFDAMEICADPQACLSFMAVSNRVEPVGPMPGLGARTRIETSFGERQILDLKVGDLVHAGAEKPPEPVLFVAERVVPSLGSFAPIRLRAPYFGLQRDIIVAPHQKLYVSGPEVEYTFGCEAVLVPAGHLINGVSAFRESGLPLVQYGQVLLPSHAIIGAAGAQFESMFIGRLRRDRERLAATMLSGVASALVPEQAPATLPILKPYEAQALMQVA